MQLLPCQKLPIFFEYITLLSYLHSQLAGLSDFRRIVPVGISVLSIRREVPVGIFLANQISDTGVVRSCRCRVRALESLKCGGRRIAERRKCVADPLNDRNGGCFEVSLSLGSGTHIVFAGMWVYEPDDCETMTTSRNYANVLMD